MERSRDVTETAGRAARGDECARGLWSGAGRRRLASDRDRRLAELAARIAALSPRLVDAWEATALVESLGYGDRAVQIEFGLSDTRLAGEYIFRAASAPDTGDRASLAASSLILHAEFGRR